MFAAADWSHGHPRSGMSGHQPSRQPVGPHRVSPVQAGLLGGGERLASTAGLFGLGRPFARPAQRGHAHPGIICAGRRGVVCPLVQNAILDPPAHFSPVARLAGGTSLAHDPAGDRGPHLKNPAAASVKFGQAVCPWPQIPFVCPLRPSGRTSQGRTLFSSQRDEPTRWNQNRIVLGRRIRSGRWPKFS